MTLGPLHRHLVIFARAPRLGTVKTRLARDLGTVAAWRFHRDTTAALLRRLGCDRRWTSWLAVTPDPRTAPGAEGGSVGGSGGLWPLPRGVRLLGQGQGDLGRRMARVFTVLPPGPLVIVGSDIPGIERADIASAFQSLQRHDAVLGPSEDGGYWLIGLRRGLANGALRHAPFDQVRWGGSSSRADTAANLAAQGANLALLRPLIDIDTADDLARWRSSA